MQGTCTAVKIGNLLYSVTAGFEEWVLIPTSWSLWGLNIENTTLHNADNMHVCHVLYSHSCHILSIHFINPMFLQPRKGCKVNRGGSRRCAADVKWGPRTGQAVCTETSGCVQSNCAAEKEVSYVYFLRKISILGRALSHCISLSLFRLS
jgi:hypothetical protein